MILENIRNFCIIAHIDHGKSTLADRLLGLTETIDQRQMKDQLLDQMDLERERGITIKLAPVRMVYKNFNLNLIDTPGHVDFSYEVSRSLMACEGCLLVVDATQGIQAQTMANLHLAQQHNLKVIAVINKIDLPTAEPHRVNQQLQSLLKCQSEDIFLISAKTGQGIESLLQAIIEQIPPPQGNQNGSVQALIFDSYYDDYRGVILYVRLMNGQLKTADQILLMAENIQAIALEVGYLKPEFVASDNLYCGEIGYVVTNLKTATQARVGDTITLTSNPVDSALIGYQPAKTYIFAGIFPSQTTMYDNLKKALDKLALSDATLSYEPENSLILGHGFRCGFLGLLHLDIITERLKREYNLEIIISNPSTAYEVLFTDNQTKTIKSASELAEISKVAELREPWVEGEIICPHTYLGGIIQLVTQIRGILGNMTYVDSLVILKFQAPLANLLTDFYDKLKSLTSGYGSLNYDLSDYRSGDLVKVDFYVAHQIVEALSLICHRQEADNLARIVVKRLKDIIPRQQFKVALQAAIGGKFIAREDIPSFRKDVTAKLYGGDSTRRKKLLEKQKRGKSKMKQIGKVELPPDTFTILMQKDGVK
ncbi:MAG: translation elongation factor 4 [Candidatus Saccharibacteria bacterium]|nr:translation elongation factor 4 [Candidatus Saccharibacteria bacterium]